MILVHVHRPSSQRYQARVRYAGHRNYKLVGKPLRSCVKAIMVLAKAMATKNYKRGDVLVTADYYDPVQVIEMVRR